MVMLKESVRPTLIVLGIPVMRSFSTHLFSNPVYSQLCPEGPSASVGVGVTVGVASAFCAETGAAE